MKTFTVGQIGENEFKIASVDKTIDVKITFYRPLDKRNKVVGKGSRKYRHDLLVMTNNYKNVKLEEALVANQ